MPDKKVIPIGIEDFKEIIDRNCYFVDKSLLIKDILDGGSKVTLFTRPRRFGKTLNLSMLKRFFEKTDEDNSYLFNNLKISDAGEKYKSYMGQYPVISISLKSMKQSKFNDSFEQFKNLVQTEIWRHTELLTTDRIMTANKNTLKMICNNTAADSAYWTALRLLSDCLYEYYEKKVIVLIDEYDVPLENSYFNGFYDKMIDLIRSVFESVLKTNDSLEFGVLTGCLRISKESIFTGLNNLKVNTVRSGEYSEYFGFTESDITNLVDYYGISDKFDEIKNWYDGYRFGLTDIYNPWSVLNYIQTALSIPDSPPEPYWSNTSSNSIIYQLVRESDQTTRDMIEELMNGKSITVPVYEDMVYSEINVNSEHIWSFLLFTGYLKQIGTELRDNILHLTLIIPNIEVKSIYQRTISQWFKDKLNSDSREKLLGALISKDSFTAENIICDWLNETISYYDEKEQYYHGFLTGLLSGFRGYSVKSNRESGDGRPDILLMERRRHETAIIIEVKSAKVFSETDLLCENALIQIEKNRYETELLNEGYTNIIKCAVVFCKKTCKVKFV